MKRPLALTGLTSVGLVVTVLTLGTDIGLLEDEPTIDGWLDRPADTTPHVAPAAPSGPERSLPDYGREHNSFPTLPGEDDHASRSIGYVTGGHLVEGRPVALPHPRLEFLDPHFDRAIHYTGDPMLELLEDAAAHVADAHPGSKVHLGNLSRRGGGDIPYSVSHNNGRDADIGFFARDDDGQPTRPPDLVSKDEDGVFDGSRREETDYPEVYLEFDTPRNWRLVEGLIESEAADLQFVFVSNPLRDKLLEEARRQNASASTMRIARQVLVQPGGTTPPHDDHFHVRIHCTPRDLASGCRERGRPGPTFERDETLFDETVAKADELLDHDDPQLRRTAVERLELLHGHMLHHRIAELVDDEDPGVRIAAARALVGHAPATDELTRQLEAEDDPRVAAALVETLTHDNFDETDALVEALERDDRIELAPGDSISTTRLAADALARRGDPQAVPALIDALVDAGADDRLQIAHALRILTNHRLVDDRRVRDDGPAAADAWRDWWAEFGDDDRDRWRTRGFEVAGYDVSELNYDDVWELCRAIDDDRHLNVNAQQALELISGESPGSLQWDPHDASFWWRRWFERREDELEIPETPEELSTADGYTEPS